MRVTAVVVSHNGERFLPHTLEGLRHQTRPANFHVGVDAGSSDSSASILQLELPVGSPVVGSSARAGFGQAVRTALAKIPAQREPASGSENQDWLWLLHDDSKPEPTALEELLLAVERAPSVTVAGSKQVAWNNPRELVDVGLSISRWAERLTLIDVDELDQGQYDARSDMFAVNSAGMLIRRDVWDALGGFDPALPGVGDDVDFCWRNRLAGHRVVVVPAAVVRHAGHRENSAATPVAARRAEVYLRLKHATWWKVPFLAVGAVLGGLGRLVLGLLGKDPGFGAGQFLASLAGVFNPIDLFRGRRLARRSRKLPRHVLRGLRTPRREVWSHRRSVVEAFTARGAYAGSDAQRGTEEDVPSNDSNDDFAALGAPAQAWVGVGAVASFGLLLAASLGGLHRLLGAPALAGGALLPLSPTSRQIWEHASAWWVTLEAGYAAHGDPFAYVLWILSLVGLGNGNAAVVAMLFLALPLAGLNAWLAAGALTRSRGLRLWAAFFWAAVPALQISLGSGRLGAVLAHVFLPLVLLGIVRALGSALAHNKPGEMILKPGVNRVPSWTAAAATGLLLAAVTASAPALLILAVPGVLAATLAFRRRGRTLWWSLLPLVALFLPFAASATDEPRGVFADPGVPLAFQPAELWQQVLGFPVLFDPAAVPPILAFLPAGPWSLVAALLIGAPVVVLAAVSLFLPAARRSGVRVAWSVATAALVLSVASLFVPTAAGSTSMITAFTGPFVSTFSLAMLSAALLGGEAILRSAQARAERNEAPRAARRTLTAAAAVLLALGPAMSLGLWIATSPGAGFGGENLVQASAPRTLPATAADRGNGADRTRTLVLRIDAEDKVSAALMRGSGTTLDSLSQLFAARTLSGPPGAVTLRADDDATAAVRRSVAAIVAGSGVDPREDLRALDVGFVVLQQSDTAAELLAGRLNSVPGLTAVGNTDTGWLWRVTAPTLGTGAADPAGLTARLRTVDADGRTEHLLAASTVEATSMVPAGAEGRRLVLAERANQGWSASLNGHRLEPASDGWAQEFTLPAEGGELQVDFASRWSPWAEIAQITIFALTVLLAIPVPARPRFVRVPQNPRRQRADALRERATNSPETEMPEIHTPEINGARR